MHYFFHGDYTEAYKFVPGTKNTVKWTFFSRTFTDDKRRTMWSLSRTEILCLLTRNTN